MLRLFGGIGSASAAPPGTPRSNAPTVTSTSSPRSGRRRACRRSSSSAATARAASSTRRTATTGCGSTTRRHERHADVFIGKFEMCHAIPVGDRLELDATTCRSPICCSPSCRSSSSPTRTGAISAAAARPRRRRRRARRRVRRPGVRARLGPVAHVHEQPRRAGRVAARLRPAGGRSGRRSWRGWTASPS